MSEIFSGVCSVSVLAAQMREAVVEIGGPYDRDRDGDRSQWLERVARRIGVTPRAVKGLFYREATYPTSRTVEKVRAALEKQRAAEARASAELATTKALVARLAARLSKDPDVARGEVDALLRLSREVGGSDCSLDS